jgi:hypothetical protein
VADIVATASGNPVAKMIKDAKTDLVDMAGTATGAYIDAREKGKPISMSTGDFVLEAARAKDLELLALRYKGLWEAVDGIQAILASIIDLVKDAISLWKAPGDILKGPKGQWAIYVIKIAEQHLKLVDAVAKLAKAINAIVDMWQKNNGDKLFVGKADGFLDKGINKLGDLKFSNFKNLKTADWLSVLKSAEDAIVNLAKAIQSIADVVEDRKAINAADAQAARQTDGSGIFIELNADRFATMTKADLIRMIHQVDSLPAAHQVTYDALAISRRLAQDIQRMNMLYNQIQSRLGPAQATADESRARVLATDKELLEIRRELDGRRYEDPMRTAVGLDLISRERRLIAEAVAGQ